MAAAWYADTLGHEAVVRPEAGAHVAVVGEPLGVPLQMVPREVQRAGGVARHQLAGELIGPGGAPEEIAAERPVVPSTFAIGREQSGEAPRKRRAQAGQAHGGREVPGDERGLRRARHDGAAAAPVARHEHGVGGAAHFAGGARPPLGRGDGARVDDLERRLEQIRAFEKERPLFGIEQRELRVHAQLGHVGFELREVGPERGVERGAGPGGPFDIGPGAQVLPPSRVRRGGQRAARRQAGELDALGVAQEARGAAGQAHGSERVSQLARIHALHDHTPRLPFPLRVAQGRERDAQLGGPGRVADGGARLPGEIGRQVVGIAAERELRLVEHPVRLDGAG